MLANVRYALLAALMPVVSMAADQRLIEGNPASPIRVLIYEDLQCPDCAAFRTMLDEKLLPAYGAKVAFDHRDFPLAKHAWARKAAIAARFFQEINTGLAIAWRKHAMASIGKMTAADFNERLAEFARKNGVDPQKAVAALDDARLAAAVEKDYQDGVARGVAHTPTVFVNGTPFVETFSYEEVSKAIDAALKQ